MKGSTCLNADDVRLAGSCCLPSAPIESASVLYNWTVPHIIWTPTGGGGDPVVSGNEIESRGSTLFTSGSVLCSYNNTQYEQLSLVFLNVLVLNDCYAHVTFICFSYSTMEKAMGDMSIGE